jgi:hypothetical protein
MPKPKFPSNLNGGEPQDSDDHRVGETRPQSPDITDVDPAHKERDLEGDASERDEDAT